MKKINKSFVKKYFPLREKNSYKTQSGRVFILAGSVNMAGAAVMAALACYRAGAGVVSMAVPKEIYPAVLKAVPCALIIPLSQKEYLNAASITFIKNYIKIMPQDVLLIGPGLGKGARYALDLLKLQIPAVIDADALTFLAKDISLLKKAAPCVLTPHEGEMSRFFKGTLPLNSAKLLGDKTGAVCLLKGPSTKVYFRGFYMENTTGNEGLAKSGSGDTLAGIIAALMAQNLHKQDGLATEQKIFNAAACGIYLHGLAADIAVKKYTKVSLIAADVEAAIPEAVKTIFKK